MVDRPSPACSAFIGYKLTPNRHATIRSHSSSVRAGSNSYSSKASTAASPSSSKPASSQRRNPSASRSRIANSRAELITKALSSLVTVELDRLQKRIPLSLDLVMPTVELDQSTMAEAEVSLRLAFHLIDGKHSEGPVVVAIDGASVKCHGREIFPVAAFLISNGWSRIDGDETEWKGLWCNTNGKQIEVHAKSGVGDVVATLRDGRRLRAEAKKGPLIKREGSKEYPLIREAIGQLMTASSANPDDLPIVLVPSSAKFNQLASDWNQLPLMQAAGIRIVTIDRNNQPRNLRLNG